MAWRYEKQWVENKKPKEDKLFQIKKLEISSDYKQGIFLPLHPEKYRGNAKEIIYRSSYELKCMEHFDNAHNVIWWQSEEIQISYYDRGKEYHRIYFPDFVIGTKDKDNKEKTIMIEVKPYIQTKLPKKSTGEDAYNRYLLELEAFATNVCKWEAAKKYCKKLGWEFQILTEHEIFGDIVI